MHFFKRHAFDVFCENSAFRRDWRSPAHILEGLGPHASDPGSPKLLPQAPFKATMNNSAYHRDWRTPGATITSNGLLASTACTFSTTCVFASVCTFRRVVVIRGRPAPSFDQYGLLAQTACTFLRRLMLIVFGRFQQTCVPLRRELHFGSPGLSP